MRIKLLSIGLWAVACALVLFAAPPAHSQTPEPIALTVALAPVQRDTTVELVALTLDGNIAESGGHTLVSGYSTFKLHNVDVNNDVQLALGFPAWAGDPYIFDPSRLSSFAVSIDGKKIPLTPARAELKIGSALRTVDWYTFTLSLASDEKKTVRFDFQQDLGDSALPRFNYGLVTAANWKGSIGSGRITLRFPDSTSLEQIVSYNPSEPIFDGNSLTWNFTNREPLSNLNLTIVRPSLWNDLLARRRAVQQNSNDANARAALGSLLRQLSSLTDSPRRDSYSAQAIAELESATRLDPNQRSARQNLATLYESRAGPAAGPRQTTYVQLAVAQWETLAGTDANARKQLAEDDFYLALDAQTRGAFADALSFMDKAQSLAPNGAGPLYTPDRATAQRRALYIAWARALLDKDDFSGATDKARLGLGDAFLKSFYPPPFYTAQAQVTMTPQSRKMVLRLVPFAAKSAQVQAALGDTVRAWQTAGAEIYLDQAPNSPDWNLTITVPFASQADLDDKLLTLAEAVPDRAEWSIMRALLSPQLLVWSAPEGIFTNSTNYREAVDLAPACTLLQGQLEGIGQTLKPLATAAATDDEAQLKQALLKNAQIGWQRALAQGRVSFNVGPGEKSVDACEARTIEYSAAPLRFEFIALIVIGVALLVGGIVLVIWMRWQKQKADPSEA